MSDQEPVDELLTRLFEFGANAAKSAVLLPESEDAEIATQEFVQFLEGIPKKVESNPQLVQQKLVLGLVLAGIMFGELDPERVPVATGYVLSGLARKKPDFLKPALELLKTAIMGGKVWKNAEGPAAQNIRDNALIIFRSSVKHSWVAEKPEWVSAEWVCLVAKAVLFPFYMDVEMIGSLSSRLEKPNAALSDRLAVEHSLQAREALEELIFRNPDFAKDALLALENANRTVEKLLPKKMRPLVLAAARRTRHSIKEAYRNAKKALKNSAKKALRPTGYSLNEGIGCSFQNVLVL